MNYVPVACKREEGRERRGEERDWLTFEFTEVVEGRDGKGKGLIVSV